MSDEFFAGFRDERVALGDVVLRVRHAPAGGTPILLVHGHPRTGATWHQVAARLLAAGHPVVCPDLRGYGASSKPADTADHAPYSKRAMAADLVALMRRLGHRRFLVVGHDRGSYVAFRLAMDHPEPVLGLAVLDGIPIAEALARCTDRFATAWWHWFFFVQPDRPERDQRRPGRLVRRRPGRDGRAGLRRVPGRDPRSGDGARDARGLPGRAGPGSGARRGRPGRRTPGALPGAGGLGDS
ncbi:MAG TPA: alpha/beta hydrolase [Pseudonocardia sp.]|nr:alpha/beta hydrolase [Pseudonocardia sp.]